MLSKLFGFGKGARQEPPRPPLQELERAASAGDLPGVQVAIAAGCAVDERLENGVTPLMAAALNGHLETCVWLRERGADVMARSNDGSTCLHWGTMNGSPDVLSWLLNAGANPDATDEKGWSAAFMSLVTDNVETLSFWLDRFPVQRFRTTDGQTLLHVAATIGQTACVVSLVEERHADLEARDSLGQTALLSALSHSQGRISRFLVDRGANVNAVCSAGATALHHAAMGGLLGACDAFARFGLDLNAKDSRGRTALHIAASRGYSRIEQCLIDMGAETNQKTNEGQTLTDLREEAARRRQFVAELALLAALPVEITLTDAHAYSTVREELETAEKLDDGPEVVSALRRKTLMMLEDLVHRYRSEPDRTEGKNTVSLKTTFDQMARVQPPEDRDW